MRTYSHALFTWVLARKGCRVAPAAAAASAAGAAFPDLPAFLGVAFFSIKRGIAPRPTMSHEELHEQFLDAAYLVGPFGGTRIFLHSLVAVALLLILYRLLGVGRLDVQRILFWFLLGWFGHTVTDFLTHAEDALPLFWPLSNWSWQSPVSYWDPGHYGRQFFLVEHGVILLSVLWLLVKRRRAPGRVLTSNQRDGKPWPWSSGRT